MIGLREAFIMVLVASTLLYGSAIKKTDGVTEMRAVLSEIFGYTS